DTRAAGVGLCEDEAVRVLCGEGPEAIAELIDRGVRFDGAEGPGGAYALCLEGAHGRPRILHAAAMRPGGRSSGPWGRPRSRRPASSCASTPPWWTCWSRAAAWSEPS